MNYRRSVIACLTVCCLLLTSIAASASAAEGTCAPGALATKVSPYAVVPDTGTASDVSVLGAMNPNQELQIGFGEKGIALEPLAGGAMPWQVELKLHAFGPAGQTESATTTELSTEYNRVDYRSSAAGLSLSFLNTDRGLEQRIVLETPPGRDANAGSLVQIVWSLFAPAGRLDLADDGQVSLSIDGRAALAFSHPTAIDAQGRSLTVDLVPSAGDDVDVSHLAIELDDHDALYPIAIELTINRDEAIKGASVTPGPLGRDWRLAPLVAPPNDMCGGAEVVPPAGPFPYLTSVTADITDATTTDDPVPPAGCPIGTPSPSRGIWYQFTPAASGTYNFSLCADAPTSTTVDDTILGVFTSSTGDCTGTFTNIVCDDDACTTESLQSVKAAVLTSGTPYFILVWKWNADPPTVGNTAVQLRVSVLTPPANDNCSTAEVIPDGTYPVLTAVTPNITDATTIGDPPTPFCATTVGRSIWYSFTPSASASYTFSSCADAPTGTTVNDTVIGVYTSCGGTGCSGPFTIVGGACDQDDCASEAAQATVTTNLLGGTTYYVIVWQSGTTAPTAGNTAVQLQVSRGALLAPPAADVCGSAEVIPFAGPFPYLTSLTASIADATRICEPTATCVSPQANVTRSIWYTFTPATTAPYSISSCANAPTGTTVDDTVISVYTSAGGCAGPLTAVATGCDNDSCTSEDLQAVLSALNLTAGTTYYILAEQRLDVAPTAGNTALQLRIDQLVPPGNDNCAGAPLLALDTPVDATNALANNDFQLSGAACFTGLTQTSSTAPGRDTVFRFIAPTSGNYSFRVQLTVSGGNPVLYTAVSCPVGAPPQTVTDCLQASNRNTNTSAFTAAEEVFCQPLAANQQVYVYVDENLATTTGGAYVIEVNRCPLEAASNDTPGTAGPIACGIEGSIDPAADADYFTLGSPGPGQRVFAFADGVSGNSNDFDVRVTNTTDTLEYDDANNDIPWGSLAPNASGTPVPGGPAYARMSHFTATVRHEPYRLYTVVQPAIASAIAETEANNTVGTANTSPVGYYSGTLPGPAPSTDIDIYRFAAAAGDLIYLGLDADPLRDATPINANLQLLDAGGSTLSTANDGCSTASTTTGAGNLSSTTPNTCGEGLTWRARYSGFYHARVAIGTTSTGATGAGDYLLSVSTNCQVTDLDSDSVVNQLDNCPNTPNPGQVDSDSDGFGDACDNCLAAPNPDQQDTNTDGIGDVCQGGSVTGLRLSKTGPLDLSPIGMEWNPSCLATDDDYEVYEGTIGSYYSHGLNVCTTGGATSATVTPIAGDRYFLIVPRGTNDLSEGSYGKSSAGAERPQGAPACLPQSIGCP